MCRVTVLHEYKRFYAAEYRRRFPEKAKLAVKRSWQKRHDYYLQASREYGRRFRQSVAQVVMDHYSNGSFRCACCSESNLDFFTIDHIDGGGLKERMALFGRPNTAGTKFYNWLIKKGFPSGYQVLCANCNMSKGKHGVCIHQTLRFALCDGTCHF
jgi:hypothetical protein